ncbi:MAG: hypothetical protein P1V20_14695 [Verrucomicrobiales bacterium]|nr:hypothetical protein [Verrucomicrobiales bacterium]
MKNHFPFYLFVSVYSVVCAVAQPGAGTTDNEPNTLELTLPSDRLFISAERLLDTMTSTGYQHRTEIDEATGSIRCDCSGLVGYLLRRNFPWAYLALQGDEAPWRTRPLSVTYYETFVNAHQSGQDRWLRTNKIADAKPGDVLSWRKDEIAKGSTTGHTLLIAGHPVQESDYLYRVRVIDSTTKIHADDTRPAGTNGVGAGTMWFVTDESHTPVGFYVDANKRLATSTKIAIGRLNPKFDPGRVITPNTGSDADFIHLTEKEAATLAKKRGLKYRIVIREGERLPLTLTIQKSRINFAIINGYVTRVERG